MNSIKKILKICGIVILCCLGLIGASLGAGFLYQYFDPVGNCLDVGGVWDSDRHECRYDCDKWVEGKGCIVFDKTKAK